MRGFLFCGLKYRLSLLLVQRVLDGLAVICMVMEASWIVKAFSVLLLN